MQTQHSVCVVVRQFMELWLGGFLELTQGIRLGNKCLYLLSCLVGPSLHPSVHLMNPLNATGLQEHIALPLFNLLDKEADNF